jgi:hypothetical protein
MQMSTARRPPFRDPRDAPDLGMELCDASPIRCPGKVKKGPASGRPWELSQPWAIVMFNSQLSPERVGADDRPDATWSCVSGESP